MKLHSVVAIALPVLALAAPNPVFSGDNSDDGDIDLDNIPEFSAELYNATDPYTYNVHPGENPEYVVRRDIEPRDDIDHYLEECNSDLVDRLCVWNLIVPKGKGKGVCTERIQKASWDGTMHILDKNIMCKYYREPGCKGKFSGPYSNQDLDYCWNTAHFNQVVDNPQSMFCQNIGFNPPYVPVKPPKPDPYPGPLYHPFLDEMMAHTCVQMEVHNSDCFRK